MNDRLLLLHLVCLALVVGDYVVRALRIKLLCDALGHPLSLRDAIATNTIGDAACALTPMRLGGEPSRLASLLRAGIPATASFVAIALESLSSWPVVIASAVVLGVWLVPGWIDQTAPVLLHGLLRNWIWIGVAIGVSVALWLVLRRRIHVTPRLTRRPWRRARVYLRRMPIGTLAIALLLALLNLACRVAVLPVLMTALDAPPPLGTQILGSFALLYSQLILPTPAGAGVVDLGLLAGAAGEVGAGSVRLLIWWRFYTALLGAGIGVWFATRDFGWPAVRRRLRGPASAG